MSTATTVQKAVLTVTSSSAGETAKSVKVWLGRTFSNGAAAIKEFAVKVGRAIADFFRNFPTHIKSGYGIGGIGIALGLGCAFTAMGLNKEEHLPARVILIIAAGALLFAAGAIMLKFGHNPVTFSRAPAPIG